MNRSEKKQSLYGEKIVKNIKYCLRISVTGILLFIFSVIFVTITNYDILFDTLFHRMRFLGFYYTLIYVIGLSILITIVLLLIRFYLPALKKILTNLNNKELQIEDNSMLRSIANEQPQKDIFELMIQNMDEIRGYFEISKSQASKAFIFSVISAVIGLIFFGVSVIIGFKDEKIDTAVIGAIAGGITEIVSIFALHIYNKTLVQLNHYHEALHKNERYLSTVHLVSKLSSERQDDTYLEIIRSSLNAKEYNEKTIINDV